MISMFKGNHGKISARRVAGLLGVGSCIIAMFLQIEHTLQIHLFYGSLALLGVTTSDKIVDAIKQKPQQIITKKEPN